jgi:hypothetical protein
MPGGGDRPGAGRPKSVVKAALDQARGDLLRQVRLAGRFIRDKSLPVGELCRTGYFLLEVLRRHERKAYKQRHPRMGSSFRVVQRHRRRAGLAPGSSLRLYGDTRIPDTQRGRNRL